MPEIPFRDYVDLRIDTLCREVKKLQGDVESLKETRATLAGKANQTSVYIAYGLSLAALVLSVIRLLQGA